MTWVVFHQNIPPPIFLICSQVYKSSQVTYVLQCRYFRSEFVHSYVVLLFEDIAIIFSTWPPTSRTRPTQQCNHSVSQFSGQNKYHGKDTLHDESVCGNKERSFAIFFSSVDLPIIWNSGDDVGVWHSTLAVLKMDIQVNHWILDHIDRYNTNGDRFLIQYMKCSDEKRVRSAPLSRVLQRCKVMRLYLQTSMPLPRFVLQLHKRIHSHSIQYPSLTYNDRFYQRVYVCTVPPILKRQKFHHWNV